MCCSPTFWSCYLSSYSLNRQTLEIVSLPNFSISLDICFFTSRIQYSLFNFQVTVVHNSLCTVVGTSGLEPPTSRLSGVRSNHLSYAPIWFSVSLRSSLLFAQSSPWALVEMRRIELLTPCLQSRCSPSWATPPYRASGSTFYHFQVPFSGTWKLNSIAHKRWPEINKLY